MIKNKAKKLLILFFCMMLFLTILSKTVDSFTVAQVTVKAPESGMLTFEANGTGIITADAKKYVNTKNNITIDKIMVNVGESVKKGDVLFILNQQDMTAAFHTAKNEVKKVENEMEQIALNHNDASINEDKSKLSLKDSKMDSSSAKLELKKARSKLKNAEAKYEAALTKAEGNIYQDKLQEYKDAKAAMDNVQISNREAIIPLQKAVSSAKDSLQALEDKDSSITDYANQYASSYGKDSKLSQDALEALYQLAYGDEDSYAKHKDAVVSLKRKLTRANEDLADASQMSEITAAKRNVSDTEDDLAAENKKESTIKTEAGNFYNAKSNSDTVKMEQALLNINQCIYGISGYKQHLKDLTTGKNKLSEAEEERDLQQNKNDIALASQQQKLSKLQKAITQLENGTYDLNNQCQTEGQEVAEAKKELEVQQNTVKTAERTLQSSQLDVNLSEKQGMNQEKTIELQLASKRIELQEKQQTVSSLESLMKDKGKVKASVSGIIDAITLEAGKKTSDEANIIIDTGGYGITVTVSKEEGSYVSSGNEMTLKQKGKKDSIKVDVEGIRFTTDKQGNDIAEITALMPKGNFIPGSSMEASITNNSENYSTCVPVSAVRNNGTGDYCLVAQPRNTVLGEELIAVPVNVTVIDKDATKVAISGSLTSEDNIIISSNKEISEGDRVRIKE